MHTQQTSTKKELAAVASLLQVAQESGQPITINLTLPVFNGILEYRIQEALDRYEAEQERIRKEQEQGDLLTPKETKAMLHGISDATLWRYVQQGIFHKKMIGGKPYYSRKEIQKIVEG